jgi:hypothetical protein
MAAFALALISKTALTLAKKNACIMFLDCILLISFQAQPF